MSWTAHDDNCTGCRPAMMDAKTGRVLPDDAPEMKLLLDVWSKTTLEERQAYHNVTCNNSRESKDLNLAGAIIQRFQMALIARSTENVTQRASRQSTN